MEKETERKTICLCSQCISAIRSRGETVFVGEPLDLYDCFEDEPICEWCDEPSDELYECLF